MSIALLDKITNRRAKAEAARVDTYRQLVVAVADDQEIDPARADAILLDAARTPAQLAADVEKFRQRRADVEAIAPLDDLRREYDECRRAQGGLREARMEFDRLERERLTALSRKESALSNRIRDCEAAMLRLKAGRPDPREADLRKEKSELQQQQGQLLNELGNSGQGLIGSLESRRKALKAGPQPHVGEFPSGLQPSIISGLPYDEGGARPI